MNLRRTTTTLILITTLVACKGRGKKDEQYKTEKVDRGTVTMTVTATGTLSAVTTVQVGSQVSGVIARLYADFNSEVKKGQLLAELDPTPFEAQVEQRRADLTQAQVQTDDARIKYERQRRLMQGGLTSQAEVDAAESQFKSANAQVRQAQAALSQVLTNLRYTKIISPIDGIVVDRQYDVGQTVAASFQAPTLFQIAQDLTKMQVQADVDQSDIGRVQVGQIARFNVDAYPEEEFRGRIAQIRYNAQVNQNVVTYPVIIEVPNPEGRLRPKMTANVTIDVSM
ncbi:MAG: efflux RND transporter periplasmic adaptor subunit, partial [Thermoanaerobaculia bacterium]